MIAADQPTCFSDELVVAVSSRNDGTVLDRTLGNIHNATIFENRKNICANVGANYADFVYQIIKYGPDVTFDVVREVSQPSNEGVYADVLYTEQPGVGLLLPVADCIGIVLYDAHRKALALAHVGRHASIAKTISKAIRLFINKGSESTDITLWMAPSVAQDDYRMEYFDHLTDPDWQGFADKREDGIHLDLVGFNKSLAVKSGVLPENIFVSTVNTATNPDYFSHSQGDTNGRFAVLAQMRPI